MKNPNSCPIEPILQFLVICFHSVCRNLKFENNKESNIKDKKTPETKQIYKKQRSQPTKPDDIHRKFLILVLPVVRKAVFPFTRRHLQKGWGLSAKLGKHSAIWGKLGTALQAYALNPSTKFPPNPTSRKVNT